MDQVKLSTQNLSKTFYAKNQTVDVLSSLNIYVKKREFVTLIGPSGCGKTTLFNCLAGIDEPSSGTITIDEEVATQRLGAIGYMQQKPLLLPWKTIEENVMLGPSIRHQSYRIAKQKAYKLLEKFELSEFIDQYPTILSGGMAQRAALLRTILFNQEFWLMDEPLGALDALTRSSTQLWLLKVWKEFQSTVLFITHDIREAILLSDRIYILSSRPATVINEVRVKLPRPRIRTMLNEKEAVGLERKLEGILLKEQNKL